MSKLSLQQKFTKMMTIISQPQLDFNSFKDLVVESYNLFPSHRAALLDVFKQIIVDKYMSNYVNSRMNNYVNEVENVLKDLVDQMNEIIDTDDPSLWSSVTWWICDIMGEVGMKYSHNLDLGEVSGEALKWQRNEILKQLMELLIKLLNKSGKCGEDCCLILMKSISKHRKYITWAIKYLGVQQINIIETLCRVLSLNNLNFIYNQAAILLMSHLNFNNNQLNLLQHCLSKTLSKSVINKEPANLNLLYFALMLSSTSNSNDPLHELSQVGLYTILDIVQKLCTIPQITQYITINYKRRLLNITNINTILQISIQVFLSSVGDPVHDLLKHVESNVGSDAYGQMCFYLLKSISSRMMLQKPSLCNLVMTNANYWINRMFTCMRHTNATLIAQLLCASDSALFCLMSILQTNHLSPELLALCPHIIDYIHPLSPLIIIQSRLENLVALIKHESLVNSQCRRLARLVYENIDLLLIKCVAQRNIQQIQLTALLLSYSYSLSDEFYTNSTAAPFVISKLHNHQLHNWSSSRNIRVFKPLMLIIDQLIRRFNRHNLVKFYLDFTINFLQSCTQSVRFSHLFVQIVLKQYISNYLSSFNHRPTKRLRNNWFRPELLCNNPPAQYNMGQLKKLNGLAIKTSNQKTDQRQTHASLTFDELILQYLLLVICNFSGSAQHNIFKTIYCVLESNLTPVLSIYLSPDTNISPKDFNIIIEMFKRYNQSPMIVSLLRLIYCHSNSSLPNNRMIGGLLTAARYLWTPSDSPRIVFNYAQNVDLDQILLFPILRRGINIKTLASKYRNYTIINSRSRLFITTIRLLECISYSHPLAEQLGQLLSYLSPSEMQAVLTHLTYFWLLPSNALTTPNISDIPLPPESAPSNNTTDDSSLFHGKTNDAVAMDTDDFMEPIVNGNDTFNQQQLQNNNNLVFSWHTLLPSVVHARIHFRALYDQFARLLSFNNYV